MVEFADFDHGPREGPAAGPPNRFGYLVNSVQIAV
jgi:hypothetical protein